MVALDTSGRTSVDASFTLDTSFTTDYSQLTNPVFDTLTVQSDTANFESSVEVTRESEGPAPAAPNRNSLFGKMQRAAQGVAAAIALARIGGLAGVPTAQEANAAIVTSADDDPEAVKRGEELAGLYRGPGKGGVLSVFVEYVGAQGLVTEFAGTAGAYNEFGAIATAHQFIDHIGKTGFKVWVCDGANYIDEQGNRYEAEVVLYPGYNSRQDRFLVPDVSVLRYVTQVNQYTPMEIAENSPLPDDTLLWGGFGLPGTLFDGYGVADGKLRAGISYVGTQGPLEGESNYFYLDTTMFLSSPDEQRLARGDSGSPFFDKDGKLVGVGARAGNGSSTYGLIVNATTPEVGVFFDEQLSGPTPNPAIPEPSTYELALAGALLWCVSRIMYGSHGFKLLKSWCPNENVHVDVRP
jgi:hypothetical protein